MQVPLKPPTGDDVRHLGAAVIEQALQDAYGRVPRNQCRSKGRGEDWGRAHVQAEALGWFIGGTPELDADFVAVCELAGIDAGRSRRAILGQLVEAGVIDAATLTSARKDAWPTGRLRQYLLGRHAEAG